MKYKLIYDETRVNAAQAFINKYNKYLIEPINVLEKVKKLARENASYYKKDSSESGKWTSWVSTAGIGLICSLEGTTKKGNPIIEVDVYVDPSFWYVGFDVEHKFKTIKESV